MFLKYRLFLSELGNLPIPKPKFKSKFKFKPTTTISLIIEKSFNIRKTAGPIVPV